MPDSWSVQTASIRRDGKEIYDATQHPLGVAAYSRSFSGELDLEELQSHLLMLTEDNIARGMTPAEARRAALLRVGGVGSIK